MAIFRRFCMFSSWFLRAARSWGNLPAFARRNGANSFGVVGTLTQPVGKMRVTPCPDTVSPPDGACVDDEIGVLSCRLAHRLCATWNAPQPRASPATAAATRRSGFLVGREVRRGASGAPPGSGAGMPASGVAADSGLMSVMAMTSLIGRAGQATSMSRKDETKAGFGQLPGWSLPVSGYRAPARAGEQRNRLPGGQRV